MTFEIRSRGGVHPHLPQPLLDGVQTTIDFEQLMEDRVRRLDKPGEDPWAMWDPGQEVLGNFFLPPFQRPAVWTREQQVRLVESALLGVSIGNLVVVDAMNEPMQSPDRFAAADRLLLDGQQRLRAIVAYRRDEFPVFAGTECEHRWSDLGVAEQRRVWHTQMGLIKVRTSDLEYCRTIYNLMNFGGTPHTKDQRA